MPTAPETGYGYIRRAQGEGPAYAVQQFVEKPDAATAGEMVASGDYLWNAGIFVWSTAAITKALQDAFFGLFSGKTADRWGWLEPLDGQPKGKRAAS